MAENEYLDSSKARRWLFVAEGIRDGCDLDELTNRVQDRLYKTFRKIPKDLPFNQMVAVAEDSAALLRLCEQIQGVGDVKDLFLTAAIENTGLVNILGESLIVGFRK